MRRSTAAAVGSLTGAALILGVRLTASAASTPAGPAPSPPARSRSSAELPTKSGTGGKAAAGEPALRDGRSRGTAADYAVGTVRVSLSVDGGKIVAAGASYPITGDRGTVNPDGIRQLRHETPRKQSAKVDEVSGATLTSAADERSLPAALDPGGA
jgi:uncharacterized protein with FMN-binding domain